MKKICMLVFGWMLMWSMALPVAAKTGNVTYFGEAHKFIFMPGSKESCTDLFTEFKDVMPGDRITQEIVVRNITFKKVDVKIYMRALGAHEDSVEFLSQLHLKVEQKGAQGNVTVFDGAASEKAQLSDWVCLGTFSSGQEAELLVTLVVPVELDNAYSSQIGKLDWEFKVEEIPKSDSGFEGGGNGDSDHESGKPGSGQGGTPDKPLTGDPLQLKLWLSLLVCSAGMMLGVLWFGVRPGSKKE